MEIIELLGKVRIFEGLSEDKIKIFADKTTVEKFPPNAVIIEEGVEGRALFIIKHGTVSVTKIDGEVETELVKLGLGEGFGEMSMLEDNMTSASVIAYNDVECLVISRQVFLDILNRNAEIAAKVYRNFNMILSERLRNTSAQLAALNKEMGM
jgi:CRP-like cAMP-binding protein